MSKTNQIQIDDFQTRPQGWVCPICGRVYSPSTPMCFYCQNNVTVITNDRTMPVQTPIRDIMVGGIDLKQTIKEDDDGLR